MTSAKQKLLLSVPAYKQNREKIGTWLRQFEENSIWIQEHFAHLKENYPDTYIAVSKGKVIKSGKDQSKIRAELESEFSEGFRGIAVSYISSKPLNFLF